MGQQRISFLSATLVLASLPNFVQSSFRSINESLALRELISHIKGSINTRGAHFYRRPGGFTQADKAELWWHKKVDANIVSQFMEEFAHHPMLSEQLIQSKLNEYNALIENMSIRSEARTEEHWNTDQDYQVLHNEFGHFLLSK